MLSEKFNTSLRLSSGSTASRDVEVRRFEVDRDAAANNNKTPHQTNKGLIKEENVIREQNASNYMRQAAMMAAVASQQKVRLSATERLALTAKRQTAQQQLGSNGSRASNNINNYNENKSQTADSLSSSLPTLETLLAVQRQLQQHTKQHLTVMPAKMVNDDDTNDNDHLSGRPVHQNSPPRGGRANGARPLPPSPLHTDTGTQGSPANSHATLIDTYEKALPPLPSALSPCTSSSGADDSQLNSLDSHQSSLETSLVSIPPPPPPLSAYLQQYDEATSSSGSGSISSSSSGISSCTNAQQQQIFTNTTPAAAAAAPISGQVSETMSSIKQFLPLPIKPYVTQCKPVSNVRQQQQHETNQVGSSNFELPTPFTYSRLQQCGANPISGSVRTRVAETNVPAQADNRPSIRPLAQQHQQVMPASNTRAPIPACKLQLQVHPQAQVAHHYQNDTIQPRRVSESVYVVQQAGQINYQEHNAIFRRTPSTPNGNQFQVQVPPPPAGLISGSDQLDLGGENIRFPTPPPPDLLLGEEDEEECVREKGEKVENHKDDDEDDDEFECEIPSPVLPHKSMSSVTFQDLRLSQNETNYEHNQAAKQSHLPLQSSSFNLVNENKTTTQLQRAQMERPMMANKSTTMMTGRQLTVHINNRPQVKGSQVNVGAKMSCTGKEPLPVNHRRIMLASPSASPSSSSSSSSDGDGHSSNSSSSTSGIHSSIESPSSSSSKLDDYNYAPSLATKGAHRRLTMDHLNLKESSLQIHHHNYEPGYQTHRSSGPPGAATSNLEQQQQQQQQRQPAAKPRPALKQKKSVSFSDKVELVACAEEQSETHLPNPLLARVLASKERQHQAA